MNTTPKIIKFLGWLTFLTGIHELIHLIQNWLFFPSLEIESICALGYIEGGRFSWGWVSIHGYASVVDSAMHWKWEILPLTSSILILIFIWKYPKDTIQA